MSQIRQKIDQANEFRKKKFYKEAVKAYDELWSNFRSYLNDWDGWNYAICLKKEGRTEDALCVCREVYKSNSNFNYLNNLYAWCIYELEIKRDIEKIKTNEANFLKAANAITMLTNQTRQTPYERTIFKVIDYLSKSRLRYPAQEINFWLDKLNQKLLSNECYRFRNQVGKDFEIPSDIEKWYAQKSKALYKLNKFNDCIIICNEALTLINKFHFRNDIWLNRRIALSQAKLGFIKEAISKLEKILLIANEWFIQYDLAKLYYSLERFDKSEKYLIESILNRGEIEKKYKAILLLSDVFFHTKQDKLAIKHAQFAMLICKKNEWNAPDKGKNILNNLNAKELKNSDYYKIVR